MQIIFFQQLHGATYVLVKFALDYDLIGTQTWIYGFYGKKTLFDSEVYLGLQTPSDGRPHMVDWNHNISLHTHTQRENHLPFLDSVLSGHEDCVGEERYLRYCNKTT